MAPIFKVYDSRQLDLEDRPSQTEPGCLILNVASTKTIAETNFGHILRLLISHAFYQLSKYTDSFGSLGCLAHGPSHDLDLEGD